MIRMHRAGFIRRRLVSLAGCCTLALTATLSCASPADAQLIHRFDATPVEAHGPDDWIHSRWSWLHVWESHRHPWLKEPSLIAEDAAQREVVSPETRAALQATGVASLIRATQPGRPAIVRQQATLALGRIGDDTSVDRLLQLLNDRDEHVSEVAWLALGLSNSARARQQLLDPGTLMRTQTMGWVVAVMLMEKPAENVLRTLAQLVMQNRDRDVSVMALTALRHHNAPGLATLAVRIMHESTDPLLVNEAMLIVGQSKQQDQIAHFKAILMTRRSGVIAATRHLMQSIRYDTTDAEINAIGAEVAALRTAAAVALGQYVYPPENRYSQRAREALRMIFEDAPPPAGPHHAHRRTYTGFEYTGATPYEIRFAALSLGRIGYADDIELLIRILRTPTLQDSHGNGIDARYFMRRSHAAIALGLYLRRMSELGIAMEASDPPDARHSSTGDRNLWRRNGALEGETPDRTRYILRKTLRSLIDVASDRDEPYDLRAACLLALGLSNSPPHTLDIRKVLDTPAGQHRIVSAYGLLALGLLGDEGVIPASARLFKDPAMQKLTTEQLMQRRFAKTLPPGEVIVIRTLLQALAKIESPRAADLARGQFGFEQWTSRQAVLTLRHQGDVGLVIPLAEFLDQLPALQREDRVMGNRVPAPLPADQAAAVAAWSLGHLLSATVEDRLATVLHQGSNYTLPLAPLRINAEAMRRQDVLYRVRCYADPFFFEQLVPAASPWPGLDFRY